MEFVGVLVITSAIVLVIAGVTAAVNESAVGFNVMAFIVALPLVVVLGVVAARAVPWVRQSLIPLAVAAVVGWTSSTAPLIVQEPLAPAPHPTAPRGLVREATVSVPEPRPRAARNRGWTGNVRRGWGSGPRSQSGSAGSPSALSSPQQAPGPSSPHAEDPTSLSFHHPISPAISPAEAAVVPSPVSLNELAESSSILLELFSQGSHDNDEVSDEHHALLANATASVLTINARIRRMRENVVPEPDCIVCYAEKADTVFMPCKHLVVCAVCLPCAGWWGPMLMRWS